MSDLSELLLSNVLIYGAPVFGFALMLGAVGIPLPTTLLVIAAGAFGRQGALEWGLAGPLGLAGAVVGDSLSFSIGYIARGWINRKFGEKSTWKQARARFERDGALAIYLTRFLITSLAYPINLIAGGSRYPYRKYFLYVLLGEATWLALYGGLGFLFGNEWEFISEFLSDFSGLLLGLIILALGVWLWLRHSRKSHPKHQQ